MLVVEDHFSEWMAGLGLPVFELNEYISVNTATHIRHKFRHPLSFASPTSGHNSRFQVFLDITGDRSLCDRIYFTSLLLTPAATSGQG